MTDDPTQPHAIPTTPGEPIAPVDPGDLGDPDRTGAAAHDTAGRPVLADP